MGRLAEAVRRPLGRARRVEGFVRLLVAGGLALVGGLWALSLAGWSTPAGLAGAGLALLGVGAMGRAIASQIER